jgi:hypothetical protein
MHTCEREREREDRKNRHKKTENTKSGKEREIRTSVNLGSHLSPLLYAAVACLAYPPPLPVELQCNIENI